MMLPQAVERYRVLPEIEFQALSSWLSTFYQFQLEWLLDQSEQAICNKSRQIGLSHTTSALGVIWAAMHGELTTIISIGELESSEVLAKAKSHAWVLQQLGSKMATPSRVNATSIEFESGGRVLALPSTGGRSFTGNVFLDEFAYQQHSAKVWDAAAAVTMLGGRLRVASTPNGVGNDFEILWRKATTGALDSWSAHEFPIQRAIDEGYPVDIKKCWSIAKGDPRLFDQLFNCKFLDGELQYIPTKAITENTEERCSVPLEGYAFAGLDIGRTVDLTALYVVRRGIDGFWRVVYRETCKRTQQQDIERMVDAAFSRFNIRRLCVDSSGLGAFPAEQLQRKHGRARVEPVVFTLNSKEALATTLYSVIVGGLMRFQRDDAQLIQDLCSLRRIITEAGNVRYDAPHTEEGHADRAWALALALHAAGLQPVSQAATNSMV